VVLPPDSISTFYLKKSAVPFRGKKIELDASSFTLFFSKDGLPPFQLKSGTCDDPSFLYGVEDAEQFYRHQGELLSNMYRGAGTELAYWMLECPADPTLGATLYDLNQDYLLLAYQGLFCYLKKKKKRRGFWPFRWLWPND